MATHSSISCLENGRKKLDMTEHAHATHKDVFQSSGPYLFWHQGLVSWKTISPWTRVWGGWFWMIQGHYISCALNF